MTGFGDAHHQAEGLAVAVEVRTINNRYFKFTMRSGEGYAALEPQVESVVREHIKRGTVQVNLWIEKQTSPDDYLINVGVLKAIVANCTRSLRISTAKPKFRCRACSPCPAW